MKTDSKRPTLPEMSRWWKDKNSHDDKGGSFNVQLYMKICEVKHYLHDNK